MTSGVYLTGAFLLAVFLIAPPLLLLLYSLRRYRREHARHGHAMPYAGAAGAAGIVLAFNGLVSLFSGAAALSGSGGFSWAHALGLSASWFCFWAWVGMNVLRARQSRRVY